MRYTISFLLASLTAGAAAAEVPRVVTDIPPVHSLVAQVMGDLGAPELLLDRGADAHDFQMRPSQAAALAGAGLVVWMGPGMTPWLSRALDGTGTGAARLTLLEAEGTHLQAFGASGEAHDHDDHGHDHAHDHAGHGHGHTGKADAHDHAHEDHAHGDHAHDDHAHDDNAHDDHAHGDHAHDHSGTDPHAWLDPHNAEVWLGLIAAELGRLDPTNAATCAANAGAAAGAIEALEEELAAILAPVKDRPFVTFHDAYGYFAGHFGLTQAGSIALGDAASPGAARLSDLRAQLGGGGAFCVFPEANHDARLSAQLAEATGTRLGPVLDPEGSSLEPGPGLYADLMRGLAQGLAECLASS
ncbi:MAG TPA: zinc ABC transporter substrate-binding protein [Paracoccaceae bacterium]|nr:zinc ABC transporter substrate-binding protein [Paracoccaceae bacterium]